MKFFLLSTAVSIDFRQHDWYDDKDDYYGVEDYKAAATWEVCDTEGGYSPTKHMARRKKPFTRYIFERRKI